MNNIFCKKVLLVLVCIQTTFAPSSFAQKGFTKIERTILDKALTMIEDYETLSAVSDEEAYYSFMELFNDEDLLIYNDLLGSSDKRMITVKEYADYQMNNAKNKQVFCTNIKKNRFWEDDGIWKVEYSFEKVSSYANKCGVYFSSRDFYGETYNMKMIVAYSEDTEKCTIESLTGDIQSTKKLAPNFYTFQKTSNSDNSLKYKGKDIKFNSYGQSFLDSDVDKEQFSCYDPDFLPLPQVDSQCRFVTMNYKARRMMIKAHYDMGLGKAFAFNENSSEVDSKASSNSFGVDFGYFFPSKSICKVGLFAGIGMTQTKMDMSYSNNDYSFRTNQDIDGDEYIRHYTNLSMTQEIKMTDVNIPVYLDFNFRTSQYLTVYFDLGVRANLNLSNNMDASAKVDYVYGVYPKYDDLLLNGNWGYNGFGKVQLSNVDLSNNDIADISKFTADAFGGAGIRIFIPKTTLAVDLGANYTFGFMDVVKASSDPLNLKGTGTYNNALIYNTMSGSSSTEHVRSLTEAVNGISRQGLKLCIGLAYKF